MMHMSVFIQPEVADAILDLIEEMSSEIDLYYEDENLAAAAPAFAKMERLVGMLHSVGIEPRETYQHIVERYRKTKQ